MNQNAEQIARDRIDEELTRSGWIVQKKKDINLGAGHLGGPSVQSYRCQIAFVRDVLLDGQAFTRNGVVDFTLFQHL